MFRGQVRENRALLTDTLILTLSNSLGDIIVRPAATLHLEMFISANIIDNRK